MKRQKQKPTSERARRSRRWKWASLGLVTLLLIWFLPMILANTPLKNRIANQLLGEAEGTLAIKKLSLGWLSPIKAEQISWSDQDGQLLLEVGELESSRVLLSLLTHQTEPGEFQIDNSTLHVDVRDDQETVTTNWEQALTKILSSEKEDAEPIDISLFLTNTSLILTKNGENPIQVPLPKLEIVTVPAASKPLLTAELGDESWASGSALITYTALPIAASEVPDSEATTTSHQVSVKANSFELDVFATLIERVSPQTRVSGIATGELLFEAALTEGKLAFESQSFELQQFLFASPDLLQAGESISADLLQLGGKAMLAENRLLLDDVLVQSEIANASLNGILDFTQLAEAPFQIERYEDFKVEGSLEIAPLTAMLPKTLRLKDGVTFHSGNLEVIAYSRIEGGGRRVFADLQSTNLGATSDSRELRLNEPLRLSISARQADQGMPVLDFFEGKSDFVTFEGQGSADQGSILGRANLSGLHAQLSQFVELGESSWAGDCDFELGWQAQQGSASNENTLAPIEVGGVATFQNLRIRSSSIELIETQPLNCQFRTSLETTSTASDQQPSWRMGPGTTTIQSGVDTVRLDWDEPWSQTEGSEFRFQYQLRGQLESLQTHFAAFIPTSLEEIRGEIVADGSARLAPTIFQVEQGPFQISGFQLSGNGFNIREPQLNGDLLIRFNRQSGKLDFDQTQFAGSVIAGLVHELSITRKESGARVKGSLAVRTELARLRSWFPSIASSNYLVWGELSGDVGLDINSKAITLSPNLSSPSLKLASKQNNAADTGSPEVLWKEEDVQIRGDIRQLFEKDQVRLSNVLVSSPRVAITAEGFVTRPSTECSLNIKGEIETDLQPLSNAALPWTYGMVQMQGRTVNPYQVFGRLGELDSSLETNQPASPPGLIVKTGLTWKRASFVGIPVDTGTIQAEFRRDVLYTEPIRIVTGEGSLSSRPTIHFENSAPRLELAEPTIIENLRLTPEITSGWISYAAPIFAGATSTSGTLSARIEQADIQLLDPFQGTASGTLSIEEGKVSPGPTSRQLISLAAQIRTMLLGGPGIISADRVALVLPKQETRFQLANGRVFHDQLVFGLDELTVVSSGSIGADQSLDLVMTIVIPPQWLKDRPIAAALAREPLRVPVRGTVSEPKIDPNIAQNLSRGFLQDAAGELLDDQIRKGLKSLFGGEN